MVFLTGSILGQNFFPILGGQRAGTSIFTFLKIGVSARAEVTKGRSIVGLYPASDKSLSDYKKWDEGQV